VITAGQQVRAQVMIEANLTNRDAVLGPRPYVKWSHEPPRAQDVPGAIARAITPAPGGGRLGFPEGHRNFAGVLPPAIGPVAETLRGHDLVLVVGSSVFPYYPYSPGPLLAEGSSLVAITSDPGEAARVPWAMPSSAT